MPVWALVMALVISAIYTVPVGIIQAITNQQIALNVVTELIVGYALPGKPIAMMMFKVGFFHGYITASHVVDYQTWGYITMAQG